MVLGFSFTINVIYCMFFFPAGHFLGNHSIIDIMRREGFAVHHMKPEDPLPKYEVYSVLYFIVFICKLNRGTSKRL